MAPKSGREGGEAKKGAPSSLVNEEPVSGHRSPLAGTPADPVAPKCLKDTKASPTRVDLQSPPQFLDPCTLRLPSGPQELEIQALRRAVQDQRDARRCRILREVAGLPLERGPHSQDKFLQTQVQKLTLELKEQKGQAQLERERLEEQLLQTQTLLQQREAELQALHKSCLVKLAHSSWVGRMLRSSTGSVEVVTAETLMDPSDSSENDEASPAREGFRLEDVDWNTIAHRYPNLFANIKSNSDYKHPRPRTPPQPPADSLPNEGGPESCGRQPRLKSVERGSPPFGGPDGSRGADSDSSSWRLDERSGVQKVTGRPPRSPGHISFQHIEPPARSSSGDSNAEPEGGAGRGGTGRLLRAQSLPNAPKEVPQSLAFPDLWSRRGLRMPVKPTQTSRARPQMPTTGLQCALGGEEGCGFEEPGAETRGSPAGGALTCHSRPSKTASCLNIVAVSLSKGFVCILNESAEETADLGGFTLQQLAGDSPVCTCRFPPHTLLEPRHHLTVRPTHRKPARPRPLPAPLTRARHYPQVWGEGPGCTKQQPPSSGGREPVHLHPSPSLVTLLLSPKGEVIVHPCCPQVLSKYQAPHGPAPAPRIFDDTDLSIDRFPLSEAQPGAEARQQRHRPRLLRKGRRREARAQSWRPGTPALSPRLTTSKLSNPQEAPAPPKRAETDDARELLPAIAQDGLSLTVYQSKTEPTVRVCRKSVDRGCPMVALSVQSKAKTRSCLPGCPPVTVDACRRV
ncbi:lamin tail domain-containing protein 2 [Glossophaga mutica]